MKRTTEIYNFIQVNEQVATSGQPTISQLESAAGEGFQTIINLGLLGQDYSLKDEAGLVRSLGMDYYHIPVEWDNPKIENFIEFEKLLNSLSSRNILIHCAANFRASAFYALYALRNMDWSEAQAREFMLPVWQGSNYPVWEKFITQIKSHRGPLLPQGGENG